jgi:hypothetical protein
MGGQAGRRGMPKEFGLDLFRNPTRHSAACLVDIKGGIGAAVGANVEAPRQARNRA